MGKRQHPCLPVDNMSEQKAMLAELPYRQFWEKVRGKYCAGTVALVYMLRKRHKRQHKSNPTDDNSEILAPDKLLQAMHQNDQRALHIMQTYNTGPAQGSFAAAAASGGECARATVGAAAVAAAAARASGPAAALSHPAGQESRNAVRGDERKNLAFPTSALRLTW